MFGFYIKHIDYNKYLGFKAGLTVWTTKDKAHVYCTLINAQMALNSIKSHVKYKHAAIIIVDIQGQEIKKII